MKSQTEKKCKHHWHRLEITMWGMVTNKDCKNLHPTKTWKEKCCLCGDERKGFRP